MSAVRTANGTLVKGMKSGDSTRPLSPEEADALARECNVRAEKLGVKARYEVTDK